MHEMAVCTELVNVVLEQARSVGATSVSRVDVTIGEVRDIVESLFDGFFHHLTRGTIAENAVVCYTRVPLTVRCKHCGEVFAVNLQSREKPRCPQCEKSIYDVVTGTEFRIDSISYVVDDEPCMQAKGA